MSDFGRIRIDDAHGGVRIKSIGANGELLENSEVLESKEAVRKHIVAMRELWSGTDQEILDRLRNASGKPAMDPEMALIRERG